MEILQVGGLGVGAAGVNILATRLLGVAEEEGGGAPAAVSFVDFSFKDITTPSFNVTIPVGTEENDILYVFAGGRSGATFTIPAGYTGQEIYSYDEGGNTKITGWYRRAGAAEGGTTEAWGTSNASRQNQLGMVVIRGCPTTGDPQDITHLKASDYTYNPSCPGGSSLTDDSLVVWMYGQRWNGTSPTEDSGYPSGAGTVGLFRRSKNNSNLGACYMLLPTAGAFSNTNWGTWAAENNLAISTAVVFKPAG